MLKNYFKIAARNLKRNLGYTSINVGGLAVGIACVVLILFYVRDELSYDAFHESADQIYRIHVGDDQVVTPTVVAPLFKRSFSEVEAVTRLYDIGRFQPPVVSRGDVNFFEAGFFYADSTVFDVFSFPLVLGEQREALSRPNTIVLTESVAKKYFGDENPIGEVLEVGSRGSTFEVTGVLKDIPPQSHVQFDFLASFSSSNWSTREIWDSANFFTYAKVQKNTSLTSFENKIAGLVANARSEGLVDEAYALSLQPLLGIRMDFEGRKIYVYLLFSIAILILLIACVNYINLSTARGGQRAREVGVRKVSGAHRLQLIQQFLGESFLTTIFALALALLFVEILLPSFNAATGKALSISYGSDPVIWIFLAGMLLLVSIAGGAYPAFMLSSFDPLKIFKANAHAGTGGNSLRRSLVVFQFAASVVLLVGTAVVFKQLEFVQTKDLGFDKERLVVLPLGLRNEMQGRYETMRAALLQESSVEQIAAINHIPGYQEGGYGFWAEGVFDNADTTPDIGGVPSDAYVVETLGLQLVAGQDFLPVNVDSIASGNYQYILNEAAARSAGWTNEEAIGKRVALSSNRQGIVKGVIADYHFLSLHEKIDPLAYFYEPWGCNYMLVRLGPGPLAPALATVEAQWSSMLPGRPFSYTFLDDELGALYRAEEQASKVFFMAAILAMFVACLGLFGLAAFTAAQRRKEVGIRKAVGASVFQVVLLLTKEFSLLVLIGFCLAVPVAFVVMQQWLQNFAYKIPLSIGLFLSAGIVVLVIAWLTVAYQAIRAAKINPVHALRYE